ncbi:tripartite tricarboxylate transporter TctB family protein [Mangrovicella endophytica]|uniref:tripartite tricarboxylate transporter TctB family protein n=1 Tax=Mangrovicella endophytica TaxID=2066697 RepID=UPI000C9E0FB9|nr:tripartite tricarboxylate transporter TctB family protein [Mangrovicella endophytica]
MNKDLASGLLLLALAGGYFWAAETIPNSMLDDAFGPRGLPVVLAGLLAFLALILVLRGVAGLRTVTADAVANDEEDDGEPDAALPRALGFLLIGAAYVVALPWLGYPVSIALLIASIALYERARRDWRLPAAAIFGGVLFWLLFNKLLGVAQPSGVLFSALFS